jgi:hypothetical protein
MITPRQAAAFWSVVEGCLVRFHGYPASRAQQELAAYRARLAEAPPGVRSDAVFHAEPFDVASWVADNPLSRCDCEEEYAAMMDAAFPESEALAEREQRARHTAWRTARNLIG